MWVFPGGGVQGVKGGSVGDEGNGFYMYAKMGFRTATLH